MMSIKQETNDSVDAMETSTSNTIHLVADVPPTPLSSTSLLLPKTSGQSLSDFLLQIEDYAPTIPDPVTSYYLNSAGFETSDARLVRVISLAAQKFISDIANESLQHCKMRGGVQSSKKAKDKRYVLSMEDITPALNEYGIVVKKPHYFA